MSFIIMLSKFSNQRKKYRHSIYLNNRKDEDDLNNYF